MNKNADDCKAAKENCPCPSQLNPSQLQTEAKLTRTEQCDGTKSYCIIWTQIPMRSFDIYH